MFQHLESNQSPIKISPFYNLILFYFILVLPLFESCSNVRTCLTRCSFLPSKCIECMLAYLDNEQLVVLECVTEDPSEQQPGEGKCPQTYHVLFYFIIHCPALHYWNLMID